MKTKIKQIEKSYLLYLLLQTILILSLLFLIKDNFAYELNNQFIENPTVTPMVIIYGNQNFDISSVEIYKYHYNIFQNMSKDKIDINGKTIDQGNTDSILITNEQEVTLNINGVSYQITTKDNQPQSISMIKFASMNGDDVKVSDLQKVVGYRITINDDFAYQLNCEIQGPVTYKVVKQTDSQIIIDVTLNAYSDNKSFDKYAKEGPDGKYSSIFTINVKDNISQYKVSDRGIFTYTEW